jgi:hypothetical protein
MAKNNFLQESFRLLGFSIKGKPTDKENQNQKSFVLPDSDDGSILVDGHGHYGYFLDTDVTQRNESELLDQYRSVARNPEAETAIEDILNEAIVEEPGKPIISIVTDNIKGEAKLKKLITEEFHNILQLLDFQNNAHEIFKTWYVDGRLFYHKIVNRDDISEGIQEVRWIDAKKIRKVREIKRVKDEATGADLIGEIEEYYLYNEEGIDDQAQQHQGIKIAPDAISYVHSGMVDTVTKVVLSHLHKAIRPLNQLRMIEDSLVIYRIARAPERRVFYVDVGNMPKNKAESYMRGLMNTYKNKMVYNAATGEMVDNRRHMAMLEDYWLPRREGGKGTEITTLQGGQNLGEMEDVHYMQKKLYRSLNVPASRLEGEQGFNLGRASEITRDELKFSKFVGRLKTRFSHLFDDMLRTQLILKGIVSDEEWDGIKEFISYEFNKDSYFSELKDAEILRERVALARDMEDMIGKYYSREYVRTNILKQTDEERVMIDQQIQDNPEENLKDEDILATDNQNKEFDPSNAIPKADKEPASKQEPVDEAYIPFSDKELLRLEFNLSDEDDNDETENPDDSKDGALVIQSS